MRLAGTSSHDGGDDAMDGTVLLLLVLTLIALIAIAVETRRADRKFR